MLTGAILCSQTSDGIEPLGAFNQPVHRSHGQIRAALLNELGAPFADYFARPDLEPQGARISWAAYQLGEPRRWIDMTAEEQARLEPERQRILQGFNRLRAQLDAAPLNSPRNNFGKLLAQACYVPGPQYLYFVGQQPVVAFWGFKTAGAPSGIDPLLLLPGAVVLPGMDAVPAAAVTPPRRRRWWWLWLLLLLLLLLLLGLGFWWTRVPLPYAAWMPVPPGGGSVVLPRGPASVGALPVPLVRNGAAGDAVTITGTMPGGAVVPGASIVPPDGMGAADMRKIGASPGPAGDQDAQVNPGALAAKTPIPANLPPLPPPAGADGKISPGAHGPPLSVPADAPPGPAAFMEGVWRSRAGLELNGNPAEEYYRFDKNGQGDVTLRTKDGQTTCTGAAHADVGADHSMTVAEASALSCSDGRTVEGATTTCRRSGETAACEGTNASEGSHFGVQMEAAPKP